MKELDSPEISTKAYPQKLRVRFGKRMAPTTSRRRWDLRFEKEAESIEIFAKLGNGKVLRLNLWCIATPWQIVQMLCNSVDLNVIHISTNRCHCMNECMKRWPGWRGGRGWIFRPTFVIHPAGQSLCHPQSPLHNLYKTGLSSASSIGILWG